jgi:hypothetical protein
VPHRNTGDPERNEDKSADSREPDALLTFKDLLGRLRCSKGQFSKIINGKVSGVPRLKTIRVGRRVFVRQATFTRWLRELENCNAAR